jgi:hypothetical protein
MFCYFNRMQISLDTKPHAVYCQDMDCGNYSTPVSPAEAANGRFCCSCGKIVKIRANRENVAFIPRHREPEPKWEYVTDKHGYMVARLVK